VWPFETADGARNMALDEASMEVAREGDVAFRVYGWDPACISLGRNQPTAGTLDGRPLAGLVPGRDVVRRPTGGRSVYHGPELTYALAAPDRLLGGPRAIYRGVHRALVAALRESGVAVDEPVAGTPAGPGRGAGVRGGPRPAIPVDLDECFVTPAPGEITIAGRKVVGSAQWRHRGAVLQHGSILLRNEQHRATVSGDGGRGAIGLEETGVTPPGVGALHEALIAALARVVGRAPDRGACPSAVRTEAAALEARYRSREWTWRR
jgi:lipoyl(octanoyl) transferase